MRSWEETPAASKPAVSDSTTEATDCIPACDPEILAEIRKLLGDDLLDRPRHGRIHLRGKFVHFPLKPVDSDAAAGSPVRSGLADRYGAEGSRCRNRAEGDSFASVLMANLGPTICHDFYFPYARKIWGRDPDTLSAIQARRRVSAGSFGKLVRKVLSQRFPGSSHREPDASSIRRRATARYRKHSPPPHRRTGRISDWARG